MTAMEGMRQFFARCFFCGKPHREGECAGRDDEDRFVPGGAMRIPPPPTYRCGYCDQDFVGERCHNCGATSAEARGVYVGRLCGVPQYRMRG